jgi:hypothetical protein
MWGGAADLGKEGINGTYGSVEPFRLFRYLDEHSFRYNNRNNMTASTTRFDLTVSQIVRMIDVGVGLLER